MKPSVAFRVDASIDMGTGHVMRCLTLANALRDKGFYCVFICREHIGHLMDLLKDNDYPVVNLGLPDSSSQAPPDFLHAHWLGTSWIVDSVQTCKALNQSNIDWLIVDHYALDNRWEQVIRPYCRKILVIDDLADRKHDCDILLDQNLGRLEQDYQGLVNSDTKLFVGLRYALLRPEFAKWRAYSLARRVESPLNKLLITMGGVDKNNVTGQVLKELSTSDMMKELEITVIMGFNAPWLNDVLEQANKISENIKVLTAVTNMAELMAETDLIIGASGGTAWERCTLGVPTILIVLAENQKMAAAALAEKNAAILLENITDIPQLLSSMSDTGIKNLQKLSRSAANLLDGEGVYRLIKEMGAPYD
jgi:UDP-2,4-diacetamido-2,4,6-trideoxy-beta-L-altropyranose hydrolase